MAKKRCGDCNGCGYVVGLGYMRAPCNKCEESGWLKIKQPDAEEEKKSTSKPKLDKRSTHYKEAVAKIKATREDMTDEEAAKTFEEEFDKL